MAHPRKDVSVERRHRHTVNAATIALATALVAATWLTLAPGLMIVGNVIGILAVLVARVALAIVLNRRLVTRMVEANAVVEWVAIEWNTKMLDINAQLVSLGFEPVGAYRLVRPVGSDDGNPVVAPVGGPKVTIEKVAAIL